MACMKIVQCWDDGVTDDIQLIEILRRHGARASFNLNFGLHGAKRVEGWKFRDKDVQRLALPELRSVYEGFTIANHTLNHPVLPGMALDEARREIMQGRI